MYTLFKNKKWVGKGLIDSGTKLAEAFGCNIITPKSKLKIKSGNIVINWGSSNLEGLQKVIKYANEVVNHPSAVKLAVNKLETFKVLENNPLTPIPVFTTDIAEAERWINNGSKVFCRTTITGSKGQGIIVATRPEELVDAPLYTLHYKKLNEYRVHIVGDCDFYIQKKKRLSSESLEERGIINRSQYVRNLANGYIFSDNIDITGKLMGDLVIIGYEAIKALGLTFGAVDIMEVEGGDLLVLEINTAPSLKNSATLEFYRTSFERWLMVDDK